MAETLLYGCALTGAMFVVLLWILCIVLLVSMNMNRTIDIMLKYASIVVVAGLSLSLMGVLAAYRLEEWCHYQSQR